ncbi:hypothetical protein AM493_18470 [Flavobacterium akiainvivens]|uniref:Lipocalin-like domain-containing protein n=1 Tax=Flavobacterium akiainvivens TaxID=1202724 RepID=A0A0M9VJI8_9FLAO|nr:hypothetical protein [Flavobacterium akiainvivens]KOS07816.1 hypothetical protein AM493_18470 [Flavobacterium akiainvivens]SFQ26928.1 hypothetical protein SAMN05444144_102276 [Flavobacterium akiainvivens]
MIKNIFTVVALFVMAVGAQAQKKVTEKDLQGRWNMTAFNMGGIILDLKKGDVTFEEEIGANLDEATKTSLKQSLMETLEGFKTSYMEFKGKEVVVHLETADTADYTIEEEDGIQYIVMTYREDGSVDDFQVELNAKELHLLTEDDGTVIEFVYEKK